MTTFARFADHRSARTGRRGSALILALVLIFGLIALGASFFHLAASVDKRGAGHVADERAFSLAEAGLSEAFEAMAGGGTGGIASRQAPAALGGGLLWVEATPLGNDLTRLVSIAAAGRGRQALEAVVYAPPAADPLFSATLNSKDVLTLNEGVHIDSFHSKNGTYASQATNTYNGIPYAEDNGDVRSNQNVVLNANALVLGDALPGPGYSVVFNNGSYVSGSITAAQTPFVFPPIVPPSLPVTGAYAVPSAASASLPAGDYHFTDLTIGKDATLTVVGPANIVVTNFTGGKTANLVVNASAGPVTVYVENAYTHTSGFQVKPSTGSPAAIAFFVNGTQNVVFPSNTKVRGAYYTPNANILFASGSECWGSFAANRIDMANDMKFHYDESLADYWKKEPEGAASLELRYWGVVPLDDPNAPDPVLARLRSDRRDPAQVLGLELGELASPAQSWAMAPQP